MRAWVKALSLWLCDVLEVIYSSDPQFLGLKMRGSVDVSRIGFSSAKSLCLRRFLDVDILIHYFESTLSIFCGIGSSWAFSVDKMLDELDFTAIKFTV